MTVAQPRTAASIRPLLLDVRNLTVIYPGKHGRPPLHAVDEVSFSIASCETVGLVGESGSGKTTVGRAILGLAPPSGGRISFDGRDLATISSRERRRLSADLQVVFQDPYSSLNPTRTIGQTLQESLRAQPNYSPQQARERALALLQRIGLDPGALGRFPSQFSGGQRQRIAIARALMANPRLVILDEPVSALDLSVQAQVLNLLGELQEEATLSYLLISHDLAVVRHLAERIIVLYRGQIMEQGRAATVYQAPAHPYTRTLLAATPVPDPEEQRRRRQQRNHLEHPARNLRSHGCPFAARCPHAVELCRSTRPQLETTPEGALVACHRWRELRHTPTVGAQPTARPAR
jgi:oligopeptide/dipeptide ABC transporter ATP-binding protein